MHSPSVPCYTFHQTYSILFNYPGLWIILRCPVVHSFFSNSNGRQFYLENPFFCVGKIHFFTLSIHFVSVYDMNFLPSPLAWNDCHRKIISFYLQKCFLYAYFQGPVECTTFSSHKCFRYVLFCSEVSFLLYNLGNLHWAAEF